MRLRDRRPGVDGHAQVTPHNDWRTNVAQGGRAEPVTLTAAEERLHACRCPRGGNAGLRALIFAQFLPGGYFILEVNAGSGLKASLCLATGVDVAFGDHSQSG